jgi:hypothetical protein
MSRALRGISIRQTRLDELTKHRPVAANPHMSPLASLDWHLQHRDWPVPTVPPRTRCIRTKLPYKRAFSYRPTTPRPCACPSPWLATHDGVHTPYSGCHDRRSRPPHCSVGKRVGYASTTSVVTPRKFVSKGVIDHLYH